MSVPPFSELPAWHALDAAQVLRTLATSASGLSTDQARQALDRHGPNRLPEPTAPPVWRRFVGQFQNLLMLVLLAAVLTTALMSHWLDAGVILAVVLLNVSIGALQEGKAEKALQAIHHMLAPRARVLRSGQQQEIDAAELVPGDVVLLASGDRVPADLRLMQLQNLRIDESALTGESMPVDKATDPVSADASLGDRLCMAYAGTMVTHGQAQAVVVATGTGTEMGRIGKLLAEVEPGQTPLVRQLAVMTRWLTLGILLAAGLLFAFGTLVRDLPASDMFMTAVGLAVSAIPEGLPAIMSITLAIGVQRMAQRHAVVRRLPAVETLGAVTVICTDKTGTLTRNEMTVQQVVLADRVVDVEGVGYGPVGGLRSGGVHLQAAELYREAPAMLALAEAAALCNDASLQLTAADWQLSGDPTEGALLSLAMKAGVEPAELVRERPRTGVIPFESEHRYMVTAHGPMLYLKGAPERVLSLCNQQRQGEGQAPLDMAYWQKAIDQQARAGRRVLALACKALPEPQALNEAPHDLAAEVASEDFTLLGLVGIIDPPREEAVRAVAACQRAGIRVKMITGDHAVTARAIAGQLGMHTGEGPAVSGPEIDQLDDAGLRQRVQEVDVFARASPEHKLRLVRALQAQGEVVAMTGDGVNDAPALKQADVGVAMGKKGTEAAKQAGAIVLADDNFASIAHAVEEGRTVYENLRKTITFFLPMNGGESLSLLAAVLLGLALPILPVQILWVNMVGSVALALVLAFEPAEPDVMQRPPRPAIEPLLSGFVVWRIALVSALFMIGIFGMFRWALSSGASVEVARTLAVNTLVSMEVFYLFSVRYLKAQSFTLSGVRGTTRVLMAVAAVGLLQLAFTFVPFMQRLFGTAALAWHELAACVLAGVALLILLELEKLLLRRLQAGKQARAATRQRSSAG